MLTKHMFVKILRSLVLLFSSVPEENLALIAQEHAQM